MKMTLDPDLAMEAKALVALAFRNGPIENCMPASHVPLAVASPGSPTLPTRR